MHFDDNGWDVLEFLFPGIHLLRVQMNRLQVIIILYMCLCDEAEIPIEIFTLVQVFIQIIEAFDCYLLVERHSVSGYLVT